MRSILVLVLAVSCCGCAARSISWRLERNQNDLLLIPPSTKQTIRVPLCSSKLKMTPSETLARRLEILASEDEGCIAPGTSARVLDAAIQHEAISPRAAWDRRYGFSRNAAHIDIAPGWRIRAITPLLKSGGYRLPSLDTNEVARGTIEVRGGSEFMGFETAFYSVAARGREPGVRVSLQSVEVRVEENQELRKESVVKLFDLPAEARHVRLIFLTRISQADHDMAVIAARTHRELESVTPKVQADPKNGCVKSGAVYCSWVPAGIAVMPQLRISVNGEDVWVPVNSTVGEADRDAAAANVRVARPWRGKAVPVEATEKDILNLVLMGGESITWRQR